MAGIIARFPALESYLNSEAMFYTVFMAVETNRLYNPCYTCLVRFDDKRVSGIQGSLDLLAVG